MIERETTSLGRWVLFGLSAIVLLVLAAFPNPARATNGLVDTFGEGPGTAGGVLSTTPRGVAVNSVTGDVYVVDSGNHRVQRFSEEGDFKSAWGADVISGSAAGTGTLNETTSVTSVVATSGAFLVGQLITGAGIQPGTRIEAVSNPGPAATLTLSKPAVSSDTGVALSVSAAPKNIPVNERQVVKVTATGGSFQLTAGTAQGFAAATTADIAFNASPSEGTESVRARLEALPQIGVGNVVATGSPGNYTIEFIGARADTNVTELLIAVGTSPLSGGNATVSTSVQGGAAYEICEVSGECKAGIRVTPTLATSPDRLAPGGSFSAPQGVVVNQSTGHLYITNQTQLRVEEFDEDGVFQRAWGSDVVKAGGAGDSPLASAVQTLTVTATGGKYTLEFQGQKTGELPFGASAGEIQAALAGLSLIGSGNVEVSGASSPFTISFKGALANNPEPDIVAASSLTEPLSGGTATIATTTPGSNGFEVCEDPADCQKGSAEGTAGAFANTIGYPAVVPVGPANAENVLIAEPGGRRVSEFTPVGEFIRSFGGDVAAAGPGNTGASGFEICSAAAFDVCKIGIAGTAPGFFALNQPTRVAADNTGVIYTVESTASGSNARRVQKFTPQVGPPVLSPADFAAATLSATTNATAPTDIAVDPTDNHVYVVKGFPSEKRVLELDSAGALVDTHVSGSGIAEVNGLGVKVGGERIYLTSATPNPRVLVLGPPLPPHPTVAPSTGVTADCAVLHGTVNPNGGPLTTSYHFEYSADGGAGWVKAKLTDTDIGSGEVAVAVEDEVCGLEPNKDYAVRLVAIKGDGPVISTGNLGDFRTDATAPSATTYAAFWDGSTDELVLRGAVNPNNTQTTYYFEYGTDQCSLGPCARTPAGQDGDAGAGGQPNTVSERVPNLLPGTTYHFRIVADNGVEVSPGLTEVRGEELTLTTPPQDEGCENEQLRAGASARLAECRAYEWVSNGDSWGVGLNLTGLAIDDKGERAQFKAQAFGQPNSAPGPFTPFTAVREADRWQVKSMLPDAELAQGSIGGANLMSSPDLDRTFWLESSLLMRQRGELRWSIRSLDGTAVLAPAPLAPITYTGGNADRSHTFIIQGASPDLSSVVFVFLHEVLGTGARFVADEPFLTQPFFSNIYQLSNLDGQSPGFDVVNRADGPSGPVLGGVCGAGLGGKAGSINDSGIVSGAISRDGSVVYFTVRPGAPPAPEPPAQGTCEGAATGGPKRLYKRVDRVDTVQVSASQCDPACAGPDGDDRYQGASSDGSAVFFISPRRLVNADGDNGPDLYLYDSSPPAGQPTLTLASAGEAVSGHPTPGIGAEVQGVLDNAADGARAYFTANGVLTGPNPRGASPLAGKPNIYVFERDDAHPTGRIAFIGTGTASDAEKLASNAFALPRSEGVGDGHVLLFTSVGRVLAEDGDSSRDLYRYDDSSGGLACLSCMGSGSFDVSILGRGVAESSATYEQQARVASADASAIPFTTKEALLEGDSNELNDVYLWREGALSLVSPGGEFDASGGGISPDGRNVFFYTRAPLVGVDTNNAPDLYDARIDGGFPEPPPPAGCSNGEQCQGPVVVPPPPVVGGSGSFAGPGNVPPSKKQCKAGKVLKKGKCVKKAGKRKKGEAKKRAGRNSKGGNR